MAGTTTRDGRGRHGPDGARNLEQAGSSFEGSCGRLAIEFRARKDDPEFWGPVTGLLQDILAAARDRKGRGPIPQHAKLLAAWDTDALVRRLTDVLPMTSEQLPASVAASSFVSAAASAWTPSVLAAFLLLGFALSACDPGPPDDHKGTGGLTGSGGTTTASGGAASSGGTSSSGGAVATGGSAGTGGSTTSPDRVDAGGAPDAPAACGTSGSALWQTIDKSTLSDEDKQALYTCLEDLKSSWCDGLNALFATQSAETIASVLQELVTCCLRTNGSATFADEYTDTVQQRLLEGMLCPVTIYKGVSFPR
jgi:hypothetical protein